MSNFIVTEIEVANKGVFDFELSYHQWDNEQDMRHSVVVDALPEIDATFLCAEDLRMIADELDRLDKLKQVERVD